VTQRESPFTRDDELRLFALKMAAGDGNMRMHLRVEKDAPLHVHVLEDAKAYYAWLTKNED
jgi:hypothetical protein